MSAEEKLLIRKIIHEYRDQDKKSFSTNIDDLIVGWYPIDEPESIDNYEPIRVVDSILNKVSDGKRKLWIAFPSSWNGKYGDSNLGAEPLFKWKEFLKRVKNARLQNNHSIFDYPLTEAENPYWEEIIEKEISKFSRILFFQLYRTMIPYFVCAYKEEDMIGQDYIKILHQKRFCTQQILA